MKKILSGIAVIACSIALVGCGNNSSKSQTSSSSSVTKKSSSVKPDPNASERTWTYKNNVFDAGNETYKFTKWEVRDSADQGKKVLVLYCDVTNNSTKEMDPSNVYMVVHAHQKNSTSDLELDPGMVALDENGDDPLQQYEDGLNNKLLPGKTVKAVMIFTLDNTNPVRVTFENPDFKVIGSKTYKVSKKISKADQARLNKSKATASSSTAQSTKAASQNNATQQSNTSNTSSTSQTYSFTTTGGEKVYVAHPSQGGTIYQTGNDTGSFEGDPDVIAQTQQMQESIAKANGWE